MLLLNLSIIPIIKSFWYIFYIPLLNQGGNSNLINAIKPHTLVKGGDYEGQDVGGQDIAQELKLIQFVDGKSTTKTIEKIQQSK